MIKNAKRIVTAHLYKGSVPAYNWWAKPLRLTRCRYELWCSGKVKRVITTDIINREVVLRELFDYAETQMWIDFDLKKRMPFQVYLTINRGERELFINSAEPIHKKFIQFLCGQGNSILQ